MPEIIGAFIGAVALLSVPLIGWVSQRITARGRLTLRVERMGAIYNAIPDSPEEDASKPHLTDGVRKLNEWLNPTAAKIRQLAVVSSIVIYVVFTGAALLLMQHVDTSVQPWTPLNVGVITGVLISLVGGVAGWLIGRWAVKNQDKEITTRQTAEAMERLNGITQGFAL